MRSIYDDELTSRANPGWWNDEQDVLAHIEDDLMNTYTTRLRSEAGTGLNYWYVQDITDSQRYGQWVKDADGTLLKFDHKAQALAWIAEHGVFLKNK